jgi:N-acetylglucosamine-6-sulfatase
MAFSRIRTGTGLIAAALALWLGSMPADAVAEPAKPNIILIMSDDEDVAAHASMPKTKALIEDQGTRFTNAFVSYALCCPSRASILRGQYAHNTKVLDNKPPLGGYETFRRRGLEESTLGTWLQAAGYRTGMIGKYLNRYVPEKHGVPPGWDDWYVGGNAHPSYDYTLNENGEVVHYGNRPEDYLTDVLARKAVQMIRGAADDDVPFFLYVQPYTPHGPSIAPPRHTGMFADAELPRGPAFDEADVSDKPAQIRGLPPLDAERLSHLENEYRKRLASLQAIDDMVESVVDTLRSVQLLDETYVIYTSDHGFHLGEHRLPSGKDTPYEEDIRVPLVMRGPGVPVGGRIDAMVVNVDLAPTIAEIAAATIPDFVDGRSFAGLLDDPDLPWRESFLLERRQFEWQLGQMVSGDDMKDGEVERAAHFNGLRATDLTYVEYGTGERELYDLQADPFQLENRIEEADPALVAALSERLAALARCAGEECQRLEDLPLPAPRAEASIGEAARARPADVRPD